MTERVAEAAGRLRRIDGGEPPQSVYEFVPIPLTAGGFMVPGDALRRWEQDRRDVEAAYLNEHRDDAAEEESEASPYWLCRSLAEHVAKEDCQQDRIECEDRQLCVTEYCPPCAAKWFVEECRKKEQPESVVSGEAGRGG